LFVPTYIREVNDESEISLHYSGLTSVTSVTFVPEACTCDGECAMKLDTVPTFEFIDQSLVVHSAVGLVGRYRMCASAGGSAVHVANVIFMNTACVFDTSDGIAPCSLDVCQGAGGSDSEECMQAVGEYCVDHPEDDVCAMLILSFDRTVSEYSTISVHRSDLNPGASVELLPVSCDCGDIACLSDLEVLSMTYENGEALTVAFAAREPHEAKLCAKTMQNTDVIVAYVNIASDGCKFKIDSELSPCFSDSCSDPTSEECMQVTMQYCVSNPEDTPCALFVPSFERELEEPTDLEVYLSGVTATVSVQFIAASCACGEGCPATDVQVLSTSASTQNMLAVQLKPATAGLFKLCASAQGGEEYDIHVLNLKVVSEDAVCTFSAGESPCTDDVCGCVMAGGVAGCDAHELDLCMQVVAEYCLTHVEDLGCAMLVPTFQRSIGMSSLRVHSDRAEPGQGATIIYPECVCGMTCDQTEAEVLSSIVDAESSLVLELSALAPIEGLQVCVGAELVAILDIVGDLGCQFTVSEMFSPCHLDACLDPESEECMQVTMEYCSTHPEDTACALFVPTYIRDIGEPAELSIHTEASIVATVSLIPSWCDCGSNCNSDEIIDSYVIGDGAVFIEYLPHTVGLNKVCVDGEHIANVRHSGAPACIFDTTQGTTPCTMDVCEDFLSEACQQQVALYCLDHPGDGGCTELVVTFVRPALEESSISVHYAGLEAGRPVSFVAVMCECGMPCEAELEVLSSSYAAEMLVVDFFIHARRDSMKLCAYMTDGSLVHVANVDVSAASCQFDAADAKSPCLADVCDSDPPTEACMQFVAEYCAYSDDRACDSFLPAFERPVGESTVIAVHVRGGSMSRVEFVTESCSCGECPPEAYSKMTVSQTLSQVVVEFLPESVGVFKLCVASDEAFETAATVTVTPSACVFDAEYSPCSADACVRDPMSEECMQLTAEYCIESNFDDGCQLHALHFERLVGEVALLSVHATAEPGMTAMFVHEDCSCAEDCHAGEVEVLSTAISDTAVTLEVLPHIAGRTVKLCVDSQHVATVSTTGSGCTFAPEERSPCFEDACLEDETSELCMQAIAAHCAASADPACHLFVGAVELLIGSPHPVAVSYPSLGNGDLLLVDASCSCEASCSTASIAVRNVQFASNMLSMVVEPFQVGVYKICLDGEHALTVTASQLEECSFLGANNPCDADECADPTSALCMQVMNEYCRHHPDDLGCDFVVPRFERVAKEITTLEIFLRQPTLTPLAKIVDAECGCACANGTTILAATYAAETRLLSLDLEPLYIGEFEVCVSGEVTAFLEVLTPEACAFAGADTPCTFDGCTTDPYGEACMAVVADYCALSEGLDEACALFVPRYFRYSGTAGKLELSLKVKDKHIDAGVFANADIRLLPEECECGAIDNVFLTTYPPNGIPLDYAAELNHDPSRSDACQRYEAKQVFVNATKVDKSRGFMTATLEYNVIGVYRACIAPAGPSSNPADYHLDVARLVVLDSQVGAECLFSLADSPCTGSCAEAVEICASDPTGAMCAATNELCAVELAQYCASHPEDEGCAFVVPEFAGTVGEGLELSLHAHGLSGHMETKVVRGECSCLDSCSTPEVSLLNVQHNLLSGVVEATFESAVPGSFKICVAPEGLTPGYQVHDLLLATVEVSDGRSCAFSLDESPCSMDACREPSSDECAQATAEYCSFYPEDEGCSAVAMLFRRTLGEVSTLRFHSKLVTPRLLVRIVPDACLCASDCDFRAVEVLSTRYSEQVVEIDVVPFLQNNYRICVSPYGWSETGDYGFYAASLVVQLPDSCVFAAVADTPCSASVCAGEEASSEACQIFATEYCANHPEDSGCELFFRPVFTRTVGETATLTMHSALLNTAASGRFVPDDICSCTSPCVPASVEIVSFEYEYGTGLLSVVINTEFVGKYKLCVAPSGVNSGFHSFEEHVAYLDVTPAAGCVFAAADSPCADSACEDPESELCAQVTVSYCALHPEDEACALIYPRFERRVDVASSLSVHIAGYTPETEIFFSKSICPCEEACNVNDVEILGITQEMDQVNVEFQAMAHGAYLVCVATKPLGIAEVLFSFPACIFNGLDSPCAAEACQVNDDVSQISRLEAELRDLLAQVPELSEHANAARQTASEAAAYAAQVNATLISYLEANGNTGAAFFAVGDVEAAMQRLGLTSDFALLRAVYVEALVRSLPSAKKSVASSYMDTQISADQAALLAQQQAHDAATALHYASMQRPAAYYPEVRFARR
jgi:hypothetical protein